MYARPQETGPGILEGRQCRHNATAYPRRHRRGSGRGPSVSQLLPRCAHDRVLILPLPAPSNRSSTASLDTSLAMNPPSLSTSLASRLALSVAIHSSLKANIPNFISTLGREAHRCTGVRCGTQAVREPQNAVDEGSSYVRPLYFLTPRIWLTTTCSPVAV
jgi:hypothetical protein